MCLKFEKALIFKVWVLSVTCIFEIFCASYQPICCKIAVSGFYFPSDGIGQIPVQILRVLNNIDGVIVREFDVRNPNSLQDFDKVSSANEMFDISIFCDAFEPGYLDKFQKIKSKIKIAYLLVESNFVLGSWVQAINTMFDCVIVPDEWNKKVALQSSVNVPIFVIPLPVTVEDILVRPLKISSNKIFTFGCVAFACVRKNLILLIDAFHKAFNDRADFRLKIHSRFGHKEPDGTPYEVVIKRRIESLGAHNIEFTTGVLSRQAYLSFMSTLDCYILLSCGEGYSISPREACAFGLPCILSDNTAHKPICKVGVAYGVRSDSVESLWEAYAQKWVDGYNCTIEDVVCALRYIPNNYQEFLKGSLMRRQWAAMFSGKSLRNMYKTLISPSAVYFSPEDVLRDGCLFTHSSLLIKKYENLKRSIGYANR